MTLKKLWPGIHFLSKGKKWCIEQAATCCYWRPKPERCPKGGYNEN